MDSYTYIDSEGVRRSKESGKIIWRPGMAYIPSKEIDSIGSPIILNAWIEAAENHIENLETLMDACQHETMQANDKIQELEEALASQN